MVSHSARTSRNRTAERDRDIPRHFLGLQLPFNNAFKNESFDNKPKAGGAPAKKTVPVTIGSRTVQALPNQRLKDVVRAARAPIKFNCENGQCGTCENRVDGRLARICTMSVPARG